MLRIVVFDGSTTVKLRLEGSLTVETVPLLIQRWADIRTRTQERTIILDLGDVVEVDQEGGRTLARFARSGVRLGYAHPNIRSALENSLCDMPEGPIFTSKIWKRFHLTDCDQRWDSPYRFCRFICAILPSSWRPCGCRTDR